jgi:hypothetical protein
MTKALCEPPTQCQDCGMISKRSFDDAISNGQRNRDTMRLIANWCSNAQVEGSGYGLLVMGETVT